LESDFEDGMEDEKMDFGDFIMNYLVDVEI